jgi:glycosyltransferase involved in cell wall biosynthesis
MKVLIDATTLLTSKSGVGHYTYKISKALINNKKFDARFFAQNNFYKNLDDIKFTKKNIFNRFLNRNIKVRYFISNSNLNYYINKNKIDIFHQPNFITYNLSIKNISTVHDLSWVHYPNFFLKDELKYFNLYFEKSLKNSTRVIVHSNFIKNEISSLFNYPKNLIEIVYEDMRIDLKKLAENKCSEFLSKFNLKYKNFFLIINTIENRKNFDFILDVYQRLDSKIRDHYPLIIFGMMGRHSHQILDKINKVKNCKYLGYLDDKLLNQCFSSAKIFFYPSMYEGFGISPIESMASGTPVLASLIDSAKEILENKAILININNQKDWIIHIKQLIDDDNIYEQIVRKGIPHTLKFKSGNTVDKILQIYEKI